MGTIARAGTAAALGLTLSGCLFCVIPVPGPGPRSGAAVQEAKEQLVVLDVAPLDCDGCPAALRQSVERLPGVQLAQIDEDRSVVTIRIADNAVSDEDVIAAVRGAGFDASVHNNAGVVSY